MESYYKAERGIACGRPALCQAGRQPVDQVEGGYNRMIDVRRNLNEIMGNIETSAAVLEEMWRI